jgi:hypothetical protein
VTESPRHLHKRKDAESGLATLAIIAMVVAFIVS